MPARGDCPFISEALHSISLSTLLPLETLIVNDGMSPLAIETSLVFKNRMNIQIIGNEGAGLVDALNTGLRHAKGMLIARLDTDDLVTPDRFQMQSEYLANNPSVVVIGSQCNYINVRGELVGASSYPSGILNTHLDFRERCLVAHPSSMYRRSSAISIQGYRSIFVFNQTVIAEDFDFWLRMSQVGLIANLDQKLIFYRQHSDQLSSKNFDAQLLGTPYIAAVNMSQKSIPTVVEFVDSFTTNKLILIQTIGKFLGCRKKIASYLLIWKIEKSYIKRINIVEKVISRIIAFLIVN